MQITSRMDGRIQLILWEGLMMFHQLRHNTFAFAPRAEQFRRSAVFESATQQDLA